MEWLGAISIFKWIGSISFLNFFNFVPSAISGASEIEWIKVLPIFHWLEAATAGIPAITEHDLVPLGNTVIVLPVILLFAYFATKSIRKKDYSLVPTSKFSAQNMSELVIGAFSNFLEDTIGHGEGKKYVPLLGTLGLFILFSNLSGLIPGMIPPTEGINTTVACALIVFFATHVIGVRQHGIKYLKQFVGPMWVIAPLMIPIEIISHLARPLSLSLRLFGNIMGDHLVFSIIFGLVPLFVPIPVLVLGTFVSIVQTLVFVMLSTVYIAGAVAEAH